MNKLLASLLIISFLSYPVLVFSIPSNWKVSTQGKTKIYTPPKNEDFKITVLPATSLKGKSAHQWFQQQANNHSNRLGKVTRRYRVDKINRKGQTILMTLREYIDAKNKKRLSSYTVWLDSGDQQQLVVANMAHDFKLYKRYVGEQIKLSNPLKNATKSSKQKQVSTTRKTKSSSTKKHKKLTGKQKWNAIRKAIRTLPGKGVKNSSLAEVWVDSRIDVIRGGLRVDTYLLFKDGSVYENCEIPPNELIVNQSKALQAKKWSKWRRSGSTYQIFNHKKGQWKNLDGKRAIKTKLNEKLNATFLSAGGSQMMGSWKRTMLFKPNGRFELSNFSMNSTPSVSVGPFVGSVHNSDKTGSSGSTVVIGTNVGGGTSSEKKDGSKNTGSYHLNEYTITLKHDNGYVHTELFFFDKANKSSFIYKDDKYWLEKG